MWEREKQLVGRVVSMYSYSRIVLVVQHSIAAWTTSVKESLCLVSFNSLEGFPHVYNVPKAKYNFISIA